MFRRLRPTHDVVLTAVTPLTPTLTRLTFAGPTLAALGVEFPTQWVKLAIPDGQSRAYTIRHHRPAQQEVDLDVVLHGGGPLSRWASVARPGARARLVGPRGGRPALDGAAHLLLAADESALPAALSLLEQLPAGTRVSAHFEIATAADALPLATRADLTVRWLPRDAGGGHGVPGDKGRLFARSATAAEPPPGSAAWVAGEASAVDDVRRHLLAGRAVPRELLHAKGYWRHGRPL
ncbi:siderophore-interacting protein [Kitasatospora sp. NPDC048538]|uniref:siderophore-interacting protein n=1 Tax=unclassified Kitasatospora TaxID=2633591 RepID=UPI0033E730AE